MVLKRVLLGQPISSEDAHHQRLRKLIALPVFASDAISSTAYATDEIMVVILTQAGVGGAMAFRPLVPIAIIVCILMVIVVLSYRQTIMAYPSGGGAYIVSRENLGKIPSLIAASSLLVDYILTVSVSVAGGVLAIRTATGLSKSWAVPICLACVLLMTIINLRGVKESGAAFAGPTYFYIVMLVILIASAMYRIFIAKNLGQIPNKLLSEEAIELSKSAKSLGWFMLLRAFSSGAVALSGVEAVSNGVPAFEKPESKNASTTLMIMGGILGSCFLGVSIIAARLKPFRGENDGNGLGLIAQHVYGGKGLMFWLTMIATFLILILAANTAYADFPRLASFVSRDGFLPKQFANLGRRLVFSNGVLFLAIVASLLIVAFNGDISKLIPLYAFGVFTGFTLSQSGMVKHHLKHKERGWQLGIVINAIGAFTTGLIAVIVVVSKFTEGAWIPALLIPIMVAGFLAVGKHYTKCAQSKEITSDYVAQRETHTMVVLVGNVNKGVMHAVTYANSLRPDRIMAVSVVSSDEERIQLEKEWHDFDMPIELNTVYSPYRELAEPVLKFVDELDDRYSDDIITVVIPEFVTSVKTQWLHNQSALQLKAKLLYRPHTAVVSVPVHLDTENGTTLEYTEAQAQIAADAKSINKSGGH
jgi:amino acid transporter